MLWLCLCARSVLLLVQVVSYICVSRACYRYCADTHFSPIVLTFVSFRPEPRRLQLRVPHRRQGPRHVAPFAPQARRVHGAPRLRRHLPARARRGVCHRQGIDARSRRRVKGHDHDALLPPRVGRHVVGGGAAQRGRRRGCLCVEGGKVSSHPER